MTNPTTQTVCHGGQPCLLEWLDDGEIPLLTTMGPCDVALYSGDEVSFYREVGLVPPNGYVGVDPTD